MLKGISPLLSPDLLHLLASMGHGDEVALVDANFPAASTAALRNRPCLTLPGIDTPTLLEAVLSVFPLDHAVTHPACVMEPQKDGGEHPPAELPEAARDIIATIEKHGAACARLERFAFYERANAVFGVVRTGELRTYGNVILKKGVIAR